MTRYAALTITLLGTSLLVGCGSTSDLQAISTLPTAGAATTAKYDANGNPVAAPADAVQLNNYHHLVVEDFTNGTQDPAAETVASAGKIFADGIAAQVRNKNTFQTVTRGPVPTQTSHTLVIGGKITRYEEGSPTMRMLVGMGAGSSYFGADVTLHDATSGAKIGKFTVDKNSWPLGGAVAANQTTGTHMSEAAGSIANSLAKARTTLETKPSNPQPAAQK